MSVSTTSLVLATSLVSPRSPASPSADVETLRSPDLHEKVLRQLLLGKPTLQIVVRFARVITNSFDSQDVARGAGFIMDKCSRGDGKVRGQNEAWANGNLLVDIRNNPL